MTRSQAALAPPLSDALSRRQTLAKVGRRLLPFTFVLYVVNYLDRTNVSFAALGMNRDLGFSATTYGLARPHGPPRGCPVARACRARVAG